MRIGEVAEQTGLTVSNIRFYEKKGLIRPDREKQNQYRDYSEEDVHRLKLILLYRKMNLSIETIGELIDGSVSIEDVLRRQITDLQREQEKLQGSIDLCTKFAKEQGLNVDACLDYVKEEERRGRSFAEVEELLEGFAEFTQYDRMVDTYGFGLWMMRHPRINRFFRLLWCMMLLLLPVAAIAGRMLEGEEISVTSILFWVAWFLFFAASFGQFWMQRKK